MGKGKLNNLFLIALIIFVIALLAIVGWVVLRNYRLSKINNYNDCVTSGYPATRSYPARCALPNGKTFTQINNN